MFEVQTLFFNTQLHFFFQKTLSLKKNLSENKYGLIKALSYCYITTKQFKIFHHKHNPSPDAPIPVEVRISQVFVH